MTKYIDAEKLKADVERLQKAAAITMEELQKDEPSERMRGELDAYDEILEFIDSLQQEQPVEETPEPYTGIYDEAYLQDKIAKATKSWKGIDTDKMLAECRGYVQPSEDLTTEIEKYFQGLWPGMETAEQCNTDMHFTPPAIMRLACHFAEWGARHSINWGDVQLLDTFILELSREEKDGADWGDSEKFYTEVIRRFHEFNDEKIPKIVAEWEAEYLKKEIPISEDLEKEIENTIDNTFCDMNGIAYLGITGYATVEDMKYIARHFANWGAEHAKKETPVNEDLEEAVEKHLDTVFGKGKHQPFYKELFIAGAEWQKEQMLKEGLPKWKKSEYCHPSYGIVTGDDGWDYLVNRNYKIQIAALNLLPKED